jgi:DNA-binding NarL/FixJ family response regulator
MHLLVAGKTIKEIAAMRSVRMETIWKHRTAVFSKMKVESEVELVHLVAELDDEQTQ